MAVFDFKSKEEKILNFWENHHIFQKSLELRKKAKKFVFFEGPPTANGRPGIHHFEGRAFKDVFNRYKTMRGFYVLRKAGWDTHGLPVELEVEKQLGFKNKKEIETYGIAKFNRKCRESVWKYKQEWETLTRRMAFWVDMKHPYITYENSYIESLWAILKKIWDKKLLYQAHKVVPFCTRCGTPLSSHEVAQGYATVTDKSVTVKFKIKNPKSHDLGSESYILAWTTTPWTLPGNVALAVGKDIIYALVKSYKNYYIVAKDLVEKVISGEFSIEKEISGSDLVGLEYEPLFEIPKLKSKNSYKIYAADFVSTGEGTGVVHTAVMYGEDDYNLGTQLGLPKVHTVTEQGKFDGVSEELDGKYVKDPKTEELIIKRLESEGKLLKTEEYEHEYPFCWRCSTPLLYYAKTSWFIKISAVRDQIIKNNQTVNWVPEHIKEGRFGQWIKEGRDWAISRERYWGTSLPIFKCVKGDHIHVVGSADELDKGALSTGNIYYVLRHGGTTRNEEGERIVGSNLNSDTYHLTEEGERQVQDAVEHLKLSEDHFDLIYASPFLRTKETAQIAAKVFHQQVKTDERLVEIRHGGACEGKSHSVCPCREQNQHVQLDSRYENGESWNDVRLRMADFLREIDAKHKNKKILIISHGDSLWLLHHISLGHTDKEILGIRGTAKDWYPKLAEAHKLSARTIPRNEYGELDLHRPFVDEVVLKCKECGADMRRVPDLIDVWFDSGAMPYAQWHWPFEGEKIFKDQFPADFIVEGVDQTRGWFYTLLAVSTLLGIRAPYKNVMSLGLVLDEKGRKMSKSKGNIVLPDQVMDEVGVDAARWYFYTINDPGDSKLFSMKEVKERLNGFLTTLENCVRFYELYASQDDHKLNVHGTAKLTHHLDKWIVSRLNVLIENVTKQMDVYDPMTATRGIEKFVVDDLSKWWLRLSRKRPESLSLLRAVLLELAKILAPFIPYTAEDIHTRLHAGHEAGTHSVHLHDWPKVNKKLIDKKLEDEERRAQETVNAGLSVRKEKQIKVRQPLSTVIISGAKFAKDVQETIRLELNVKNIEYVKTGKFSLDSTLTPELRAEGYAREFMRQVQDMRKEAGYHFDQKVYCQWFSEDAELSAAIFQWTDLIRADTVLSKLEKLRHDKKVYDVEKEFDITPGKKIWIGIRK